MGRLYSRVKKSLGLAKLLSLCVSFLGDARTRTLNVFKSALILTLVASNTLRYCYYYSANRLELLA